MRAALIVNDSVVNVIEYDPENDFDPGEYELVELDNEIVGPGWRRVLGELLPPAEKFLKTEPAQIPADDSSVSVVTYKNTYDDAPTNVVFDVNGATASVSLTEGEAQIEVTAAQLGDILVTCDDLTTTITVVEA